MKTLIQMYQPFFDLNNWRTVFSSMDDWLVIFSLVLMECLLSVDNAIVLAAQTQSLPTKKQQEKSLFYGIWGAYLFRFIVIGIGIYLIHFWFIKILGALYLLYLSMRYFYDLRHPKAAKKQKAKKQARQNKHHILSQFWQVVLSIEAMDIVFSMDSVLASLAISNNPVIVLLGGIIGILAMRGVAEVIMRLMRMIPELQTMAYLLIAFIAVKLFISIPAINIEIPNLLFAVIVFGSVVMTISIHFVHMHRQI